MLYLPAARRPAGWLQRPVHPHPTGNTYERQAIEQWWKTGHRFCPRTGGSITGFVVPYCFSPPGIRWLTQWCGSGGGSAVTRPALMAAALPPGQAMIRRDAISRRVVSKQDRAQMASRRNAPNLPGHWTCGKLVHQTHTSNSQVRCMLLGRGRRWPDTHGDTLRPLRSLRSRRFCLD